MTPTLAALAGWPLLVGLVLALGGVAARLFIVPRLPRRDIGPSEPMGGATVDAATGVDETRGAAAPTENDPTTGAAATTWAHAATGADAAARIGLAGALLLPPALGLVFVRQLLEFRDPFVPWREDARLLLLGTAWGATWLWALAASVVCAAGFALAARGLRSGWWLGAPAALLLGFFPALTGHASGAGGLRWLTITADGLHVYAAGAWLGGLAFVLYADRRTRRSAAAGALPVLVPLFSRVAVACVATLILTGTLAAWIHMPGVGAFVSAPYGRLLGLKLILALSVFGLGAVNWRRLTTRLSDAGGSGERALRRVATVELWLAQIVLLVTAALVRTAP